MRKAVKTIFVLMLCFAISFMSLGVFAVSQAEIDALEKEREELEANGRNIQEQLEAFEDSREAMLEKKAALDEQCELLRQDILLINEQIEIYDRIIEEKKEEAEEAKAEEERHYELYRQRVRDMEEHSAWTYISYIFKADSISDLLGRFSDISDIMRYDECLREDYIAAHWRAVRALAEHLEAQEARNEKQAELRKQEVELEEKIQGSQMLIEEIENNIDNYYEYYETVESELVKVQKIIDEKAEELRKQQEAAKNQTSTGTIVGSGYYAWPSYCTYITSPFGPRVHPIYGELKPHTGVDIGASYGTAITASASGTVSLAVVDYSSVGYGTYVAIYHPNGTTTLYAHMSSLAVSSGQQVAQGQVIGYVGSTGASNGPHIHFEIRQNGVCVNPMQYF